MRPSTLDAFGYAGRNPRADIFIFFVHPLSRVNGTGGNFLHGDDFVGKVLAC